MLSVSASRASSIRSDDEGSGADVPEQSQAGDGQSGDGSREDVCISTAILLGKRTQLKPSADDFQPEICPKKAKSPQLDQGPFDSADDSKKADTSSTDRPAQDEGLLLQGPRASLSQLQRQLAPPSHPPSLPRSPIGPLASGWPQVDVGFYVDCGMLPPSALGSEPTSEPADGDSRFETSEGSLDNAEQQADVDVLFVLAADAAARNGGTGESKTGAANPTTVEDLQPERSSNLEEASSDSSEPQAGVATSKADNLAEPAFLQSVAIDESSLSEQLVKLFTSASNVRSMPLPASEASPTGCFGTPRHAVCRSGCESEDSGSSDSAFSRDSVRTVEMSPCICRACAQVSPEGGSCFTNLKVPAAADPPSALGSLCDASDGEESERIPRGLLERSSASGQDRTLALPQATFKLARELASPLSFRPLFSSIRPRNAIARRSMARRWLQLDELEA